MVFEFFIAISNTAAPAEYDRLIALYVGSGVREKAPREVVVTHKDSAARESAR